ncbi:hypothetical protein ERO13_D04G063100v2 [Gossypium hirsutum]|uniref:Uncharacterized protein isoform X1 n=5 Tax=Gossypium TaxID=3633 RepID=A0A1U8J8M0_GOSHI|nr:uncharacterized protein LOC107904730 isoform X1 [Gossypium hirsutum]KAB2034238.1 hypothetical protein ES319_D04G070800v1 [Gossypium barbadense]KAG4151411.1 hypothetical protein ERO13_D04G063100v2 [Gossypium hirsutum]
MSQRGSNPDGNTQASRFINEFPVFMNQIDLLIAKYEKLVDTEATQLDEINSLKVMVADKDEKIRIHEQLCRELQKEANELKANLEKTKKEHDVKVSELEEKLKAKEKEVGKMINKVEEMANSMTWEKLRSLNLRSAPQLDDSPNTHRSRSRDRYKDKSRSPSRVGRCSRSSSESEDDYRNELRKTMWPGKRRKSKSKDRGSSR